MTTLRILSYNIHKGKSPFLLSESLSAIRDSIREVNADIVFLQEICGAQNGTADVDSRTTSQLEFLADEVWSHYSYGKNAVYDSGHHGNAILSKFPIVEFRNTDVSAHRFEQRGILFARVDVPGAVTIDCYCLHFGLFAKGRSQQLSDLCQKVLTLSDASTPVIIAGDFNDWGMRAAAPLQYKLGVIDAHISKHNRHARTFPSRFPFLPLDRVYVRGLKVDTVAVLHGRRWAAISDHAPLVAQVTFG